MLVNDPIADMLTRIRNAQIARHDSVVIPASNMKKSIAKILLDEGYIKSVDVIDDGLGGQIKIGLKYTDKKQSVIVGLKRISKPGLRVYAQCEELPKVLGGLGIAIVSTSKGVMTDKQAPRAKVARRFRLHWLTSRNEVETSSERKTSDASRPRHAYRSDTTL